MPELRGLGTSDRRVAQSTHMRCYQGLESTHSQNEVHHEEIEWLQPTEDRRAMG
jgi:phosphohistidine phosphatase SixA